MTVPTYDPEISLTENLTANGFSHRESKVFQCRQVYDPKTYEIIGDFNHVACTNWLKARVEAYQQKAVTP